MATKKTKSIEELLKEAGFSTVQVISDRVIHAKVTDDKTFGSAHAAFVQAACKHPALVGAIRLPMATASDVLVVHVKAVEGVQNVEAVKGEEANTAPAPESEPKD